MYHIPMNYFDTHFHLTAMQDKGIDLDSLRGIEGMDIGCDPGDIVRRIEVIRKFPSLYFSVGADPGAAASERSASEIASQIKKEAEEYKADFIGEIGLDYYWNYGAPGKMEDLFTLQLDIANELNLPVAIHTRNADIKTLEILSSHKNTKCGLIHCFSSDKETAKAFLDLGFCISFAGNVTYRSNDCLRAAAAYTPLDRILLETDSPYLSPVPVRGKTNTPLNIEYTYKVVAEIKDISCQELNEIVKENFKRILVL